jgi:hypothetical protein
MGSGKAWGRIVENVSMVPLERVKIALLALKVEHCAIFAADRKYSKWAAEMPQ